MMITINNQATIMNEINQKIFPWLGFYESRHSFESSILAFQLKCKLDV